MCFLSLISIYMHVSYTDIYIRLIYISIPKLFVYTYPSLSIKWSICSIITYIYIYIYIHIYTHISTTLHISLFFFLYMYIDLFNMISSSSLWYHVFFSCIIVSILSILSIVSIYMYILCKLSNLQYLYYFFYVSFLFHLFFLCRVLSCLILSNYRSNSYVLQSIKI